MKCQSISRLARIGVFASFFGLAALSHAASGLTGYKVQQVNPAGATASYAIALNKTNVVVGYFTAGNSTEGYALIGTQYKTIVFPGSNNFTRANGINDGGLVIGDFLGSDNFYHGYILSNNGTKFTQYDVNKGVVSTSIFGVNNSGNFAGSAGNQGFVNLGGAVTEFYANGNHTTVAFAINSANQVVGQYLDSSNNSHGFFRDASGSITEIDYPGATQTSCRGINDSGVISGWYVDSGGQYHGFLDNAGVFTSLPFYVASGINNAGSLAGWYVGPGAPNGETYGYLATPKLFTGFETFQLNGESNTKVYGINDSNAVVGSYTDQTGTMYGFSYANGNLTSLFDPSGLATAAKGINSSGQIVGFYVPTSNPGYNLGFFYSAATGFKDVVPPGAGFSQARDINKSSVIAGWAVNPTSLPTNAYSFTYNPATKIWNEFSVPNAQGTYANGINDAGIVTVAFLDQNGILEGALYNGSTFTIVDVPGAYNTGAADINNSGDVVFNWTDQSGNGHGAILSAGSYYVFDVPASAGANTSCNAINNSGVFVGYFMQADGSFESYGGKL